MKSLEARLASGLLLALLVVFTLLLWGASVAVESLGRSYVQTRLEHDAEALLGAVRRAPDGSARLRAGRVTPIYQQPLSGHYFEIAFSDGTRLRSRSLWDYDLVLPSVALGAVRRDIIDGPGEQRLLVRSAGYEKDGIGFTLTVAEDLAPLLVQMTQIRWLALAVLVVALLVVLVAQRLLLRRSFRELDSVRTELREVADGEREQIDSLGPAEVQPLTTEVNRLLTQLQQRLQRSRRAVGNLAHALKGPLSLMTHDLDALPMSEAQRTQTRRRLDRVAQLVERELKRARFAGEGGGQRFRPARDVPDLVDALRRLYQSRKLDIRVLELSEAMSPFDYDDMLELLGNLLDNACKWARETIEIRVTLADNLVVTVADDGPGIPQDAREALLRRGTRLDEEVEGTGLGLAIVGDLVRHYRGQITLTAAPRLGGLEVCVTLPLLVPTAA